MRPFVRTLVAASLVVVPVALAQQAGDPIPDEYLVMVQPGVDPGALARGHGLGPRHVYGSVVNGFAGFVPPGRLRALATDPRVIAIAPNRIVSIGAKPGGVGGGGGGSGEVTPVGVFRVGAPSVWGTATGLGVGVAIVDTGIDFGHADLQPVLDGFNAIGEGPAQDDHGHGTHVAGTVAARRGNGTGVVGVAPGATLFAVKVLNAQGSGSDAAVVAGLDWISAHADALNIKVANMSLGRPASGDDSVMHEAIKRLVGAGVTVVVSAGNDCGADVSELVPSGFAEVIAVGSTTAVAGSSAIAGYATPADMASYFTTDGLGVTISAPGEEKENVLKGYRLQSVGILSLKLGGGTTRMSGTSMASPHVAGVAALICEEYPALRPSEVRTRIAASPTADSVPLGGITTCYTPDGELEGVVDAVSALE